MARGPQASSPAYGHGPRSRSSLPNGPVGFALLEVMVALAILAVALSAIVAAVGGGARATLWAELAFQTLAAAENRLAETADGPWPDDRRLPFEEEGETAGIAWRVVGRAYMPEDLELPSLDREDPRLMLIEVTATPPEGAPVVLRTLRPVR